MTVERVARIVAGGILTIFGLLVLITLLNGAFFQALKHLFVGWIGFLSRNFKAFALDPDIIVSGLIAGIVSLILLHIIARWLSAHLGARWSFRSSASLFGFILILFATSFLVPGVIAITKLSLSEPWTAHSRSAEYHVHKGNLAQLQMSLYEYCLEEEGRIAPWDVDSIFRADSALFRSPFDNAFANSGYLNLCAGLDPFADKIPLFASPEFAYKGSRGRLIIFNDSTYEFIDAERLNEVLKDVTLMHRAKNEGSDTNPGSSSP